MASPLPFRFDAGHPALDFLNTRAGPDDGSDLLTAAPDAVWRWLEAAGLLPERGASGAEGGAGALPLHRLLLTEALRLREAVGDALEALRSGAPLPAPRVHELARALEAGVWRRVLERPAVAGGDGDAPRVRQRAEARDVPGLLAPLADAAVSLLTTADPGRIRRCDDPRCRAWFLDTSRSGRRRWCSMARCGNRAKAARHYRRTRSSRSDAAES